MVYIFLVFFFCFKSVWSFEKFGLSVFHGSVFIFAGFPSPIINHIRFLHHFLETIIIR